MQCSSFALTPNCLLVSMPGQQAVDVWQMQANSILVGLHMLRILALSDLHLPGRVCQASGSLYTVTTGQYTNAVLLCCCKVVCDFCV